MNATGMSRLIATIQRLRANRGTMVCGAFVMLLAGLLLLEPRKPRPWKELFHPLDVGKPVATGHVLRQPRPGTERDVVFVAERPEDQSLVEVHVLRRGQWADAQETRSFGVAYETQATNASTQDAHAVTTALAAALRKNDPGDLAVSDIGLVSSERSDLATLVAGLAGHRGRFAAALLSLGFVMLGWGGGPAPVAATLFALGIGLRAAHLGLPFERGQDIQRALTGGLPISEIVTGLGLRDRHPPLYFLVLHAAQSFGQTEAIVRWPAVIAGSLLGPAIYALVPSDERRRAATTLSALGLAIAPLLIQSSREVSEISLFSLLIVAAIASTTTAIPRGRLGFAVLVVLHALLFWTYYLAVFVVAAELLVLLLLGRRDTWIPISTGALLGLPAIVLGFLTFVRDRPARLAAAATPKFAWGNNDAPTLARDAFGTLSECLGLGALGVAIALGVAAMAWGRPRTSACLLMAVIPGTVLAMAALAPWARIQPYYALAVAPLLAGAIPVSLHALTRSTLPWLAVSSMLMVDIVANRAPALADATKIWETPPNEFGPTFAEAITRFPEATVLTVMHYDSTHIAWYLARRAGRAINWASLQHDGDGRIRSAAFDAELVPLLYSHSGDASDARAVARLNEVLAKRAALVVHRPLLPLPETTQLLSGCPLLAHTSTAELRSCGAGHRWSAPGRWR